MQLHMPPALVLNADYRPVDLFPLSTLDWHDSVKAAVKGSHVVVAEHDVLVRSPSIVMKLPAVLALREYHPPPRRVPFTRLHVFLRDRFRCQYCADTEHRLTFDHVIPRSKGGKTTWQNIVAACDACNVKKDAHHAVPMKVPREPSVGEIEALKRHYPPPKIYDTWKDWLTYDLAA
jgi:5-methylcytosine-specific restriction endonuclease McrA